MAFFGGIILPGSMGINIEAIARKPMNQAVLIMRWDRGILMAKEHQLIGLQKIFVLFSPCGIEPANLNK